MRYIRVVSTQHDGAKSVRFDRPPVQAVELTVFFEEIDGLQVSHLSALREAWRREYPDSDELPPLRPHNRGGAEAAVQAIGRAWPFPYLMLSTPDGRGGVAIQNDRFTRSWAFTLEADKYPGFATLSADLESRLEIFAEHVRRETDQELTFTGASCMYNNRIDGYTAEQMLVGIATRWSTKVEAESLRAMYAGVRLHTCSDDALEGCYVNLALDVDGDGCFLIFESERDQRPDDDNLRLAGLDIAHDQLIQKFVEFTSPAMQEEWGRQQ